MTPNDAPSPADGASTSADLLSRATHNLRQPLHALGLTLQALTLTADHPPDPAILAALRQAHADIAGQLERLITIARVDAGRYDAAPTSMDLGELYEEARAHAVGSTERTDLDWRSYGWTGNVTVNGEVLLLALDALLENAAAFSVDGRILVGARRTPGALRIECWNVAHPVPAAKLHELAQAAVTVAEDPRQKGRRTAGRGTGLGLSLGDRCAQRLGGQLAVSQPGGALFRTTLTLPTTGI